MKLSPFKDRFKRNNDENKLELFDTAITYCDTDNIWRKRLSLPSMFFLNSTIEWNEYGTPKRSDGPASTNVNGRMEYWVNTAPVSLFEFKLANS